MSPREQDLQVILHTKLKMKEKEWAYNIQKYMGEELVQLRGQQYLISNIIHRQIQEYQALAFPDIFSNMKGTFWGNCIVPNV